MGLLDDRPTNPAKHFMKISSGAVKYYDKQSGQNIEVPTPFEFIFLDQRATIKGWSDADDSGYWSNEVKLVGKEEFNIRTSQGKKLSGIWSEIKKDPRVAGSQFNAVVYLAHKSENGMDISTLSFKGATLKAWLDFSKKYNLSKNKVILSGWDDAKKGAVKYKVPVFEVVPMEDAERDEARKLAQQLKEYHDEYYSYKPATGDVDTRKEESFDDGSINLDEIPFGN